MRKPERRREKTRSLRCKIEASSIGTAHNVSEAVERRALQSEFGQHGVEGAGATTMAPEHAFDVKRRGLEAICYVRNLRKVKGRASDVGVSVVCGQSGSDPRPWGTTNLR